MNERLDVPGGWCTAPFWISVLTQKSCMLVMIVAYAMGFGGGGGGGDVYGDGVGAAAGMGMAAAMKMKTKTEVGGEDAAGEEQNVSSGGEDRRRRHRRGSKCAGGKCCAAGRWGGLLQSTAEESPSPPPPPPSRSTVCRVCEADYVDAAKETTTTDEEEGEGEELEEEGVTAAGAGGADGELREMSWCVVRLPKNENMLAKEVEVDGEANYARVAMTSLYTAGAFNGDGDGDGYIDGDDDEEVRRALERYPLLTVLTGALLLRRRRPTTATVAATATVTATAKRHRLRLVVPLACWLALEMFWQVFFYLWLGTKQTRWYPCFVVCWGEVIGDGVGGSNPPSPLSLGYGYPPFV